MGFRFPLSSSTRRKNPVRCILEMGEGVLTSGAHTLKHPIQNPPDKPVLLQKNFFPPYPMAEFKMLRVPKGPYPRLL